MAGDWIVWCKGLARKRKVLAIAREVSWSRKETAATLMEFWEWADAETEDGGLPGMTVGDLVNAVPDTTEGFWLALVKVGWLTATSDGLAIPEFREWMGQSAKSRLRKNQRQAQWRENVDANVDTRPSTEAPTTVEKRRVEKNASAADKPPRPRDELFDAVVEVTSSDPKSSGPNIGRVCKALREADPPYTPAEVLSLPAVIAAQGLSFTFTLNCIPKYIGWVRKPPKKTGAATAPEPDLRGVSRKLAEQDAEAARNAVPAPGKRKAQVDENGRP